MDDPSQWALCHAGHNGVDSPRATCRGVLARAASGERAAMIGRSGWAQGASRALNDIRREDARMRNK